MITNSIVSWCSWCYTKSEHKIIDRSYLTRNTYQCQHCQLFTHQCRIPTCYHMTRGYRGLKGDDSLLNCTKKWSNELCDAHDGTLDAFTQDKNLLTKMLAKKNISINTLRKNPSSNTKVLFINGFLNQGNYDFTDWMTTEQSLSSDHNYYGICWPSYNFSELAKWVDNTRSKVSVLPAVINIIKNPWSNAISNARKTGILLANIMANDSKFEYILCGHSLGARVIHEILHVLTVKNLKIVKDVHLFGGAMDSVGYEWDFVSQTVEGRINNYYSLKDDVLKYLYQSSMLFMSNPIGLNAIDAINNSKINNINVTDTVKGHNKYNAIFNKIFEIPFSHKLNRYA